MREPELYALNSVKRTGGDLVVSAKNDGLRKGRKAPLALARPEPLDTGLTLYRG